MKRLMTTFGPALGLLGLCALLALLTPAFATPSNLTNVLLQSAIIAVLAVGMTFVILTGGIDLSVGSVLALSGMALGKLMAAGLPVGLAVVLCLLVGALCGTLNGLLISRGGLPPFIATLGMMSAAHGLTLVISPQPVSNFSEGFLGVAHGMVLIAVMGIVYAAAAVILGRTTFGRSVYAVGGNEQAAWLSGIPTGRVKTLVYTLAGVLSALASVMLTARLNSAQPTAGQGYELDAIAAVVIGGTSLSGGRGGVFGTLIGALIMSVLRNGLNLLSVQADMQLVVIGVVIIVAVLVDRARDTIGERLQQVRERFPVPAALGAAALIVALLAGAWAWRSAHDTGRVQLALVLKTLNNPFWVDVRDAAKETADRLGVDLVVAAPDRETDVNAQMQIIEDQIQRRVGAIILAPSGSSQVVSAIKKANDAGVPVLIVDTRVDEPTMKQQGAHTETFVGSDNIEGGRLAGEALAKALNGKGRVLLIEGIAGHETGDARKSGFLSAIAKHPGIVVAVTQTANWEQEKAFNVTQNVLQSDPSINGIFACNDVMAMGAVQALKAMNRQDILVVGFDASVDARKAIKDGWMLGSVAQYPREMGRLSVEKAVELLHGGKIEGSIPTKVDVVQRGGSGAP